MIKNNAHVILSVSGDAVEEKNPQLSNALLASSTAIPSVFANSNLWIRFVNKREKITQLINMAYNSAEELSDEAKKKLSGMFREELSGYNSMYFNTTNDEAGKFWRMRNRLSPLLNSILFLPKIIVTVENPLNESETITYNNELDLLISNLIPSNENFNKTQIENLEAVLARIKGQFNPQGHPDLRNTIRINSFETKWITDDFLTQEGTLEIWVEHHQLLKTDFMKEMLRLNKRIDITTGFYQPFENSTQFYSFMDLFDNQKSSIVGPTEANITWDEYRDFIEASELELSNAHWVINNFNIKYDENNAATVTINLVKFAVSPLKQSSIDNIKPINLLTKEVIEFFRSNGIIKLTVVDPKKATTKDGTIYVPLSVVENNNISTQSWSKENSEYMTFMVLDESRFVMYLLWLYANKYADFFDETEGKANDKKFNRNFLITLEIDATSPNKTVGYKERFNGNLMSYVDMTLEDDNAYKSFSLFDLNKVNNWFENQSDENNKYTDFAIPFRSTFDSEERITKSYRWNQKEGSYIEVPIKADGDDPIFKNEIQEHVYMSLVSEYIQEDMIVSNKIKPKDSAMATDKSYEDDAMNASELCTPKSFLQSPPNPPPITNLETRRGFNREALLAGVRTPSEAIFDRNIVGYDPTQQPIYTQDTGVKYETEDIREVVIRQKMEELRKQGIERIQNDHVIGYGQSDTILQIGYGSAKSGSWGKLITNWWWYEKNFWYPAIYGTVKDSQKWFICKENGYAAESLSPSDNLKVFYVSEYAPYIKNNLENQKLIKDNEERARQLAEEVLREEARVKENCDSIKAKNKRQLSSNDSESSEIIKPTEYFSYHYTFPYYKVAVSDDKWLQQFDSSIQDFVLNSIKRVVRSRRNASIHFSIPNIQNKIELKRLDNDILLSFNKKGDKKFSDINEVVWDRKSSGKINSYDSNDEKTKKDNQKRESYIQNQLSNPEDLKITIIPRNSNSYDTAFDNNMIEFVNNNILQNGNEDWLEIRISDFSQLWLTKSELDLYAEIQKSVFNEFDKNAIISINQIYDNNIVTIQTISEMISDMPYELGVFNADTLNNDTYGERIKNIKNNVRNINTLLGEDKTRIENSLTLMETIVNASDQRSSMIKNIVDWTTKAKDNLDSYQLFNSISGSYFFTNVADIGVKERLMPTLYDLLYYTIDSESWYVPKFRPFTPVFLYTGGEQAISLYKKLIENPQAGLEGEEVALLNTRISPQSGLYYITEMSEKITGDGLWLQNWKGKKYDQGFLSLIYNELFRENNNKVLRSNILNSLNDEYNFFNTIYTLSPTLMEEKEYSDIFNNYSVSTNASNIMMTKCRNIFRLLNNKSSTVYKWIDEIKNLLYHFNNLNYRWDNNDEWKEAYRSTHLHLILLYAYIMNNLSEYDTSNAIRTDNCVFGNGYPKFDLSNISGVQSLWPLNDSSDKFETMLRKIEGNYSPRALKSKFGDQWFNYYPIRYFDYSPEFLKLCNIKVWECFGLYENKMYNSYNQYIAGFLNKWNGGASEFATLVDSSDAFINNYNNDVFRPHYGKLYTSIGEFEAAVNNKDVTIDVGTFITIQRKTHPAIDEINLTPMLSDDDYITIGGKQISNDKLLTYDSFSTKFGLKNNNAWITTEKYLVLDAPFTMTIIRDMISNDFIGSFGQISSEASSSITSWDSYIYYSTNDDSRQYDYLTKYGLAFGQRLYDVKNVKTYLEIQLVRYAWTFLTNFYEKYDTEQMIYDRDTKRVKFGDRVDYPDKYIEIYKNYVNEDNYNIYENAVYTLKQILSNIGLRNLYETIILEKINDGLSGLEASSSAMFTEENQGELQIFIDNIYQKQKKTYSALILNDILYKFLKEWLIKANEKIQLDYFEESKKSWTYCFYNPMLFDFIAVYMVNIGAPGLDWPLYDSTRFSAIRWVYDGTKTPVSNLFGGEFVANMSLKQLTYEDMRCEDPMLELGGINFSKSSDILRSNQSYDKVFKLRDSIIKYDEKYQKSHKYNIENSSGDAGDRKYFEEKYGQIRWIVNDIWTYNKFMNGEEFNSGAMWQIKNTE